MKLHMRDNICEEWNQNSRIWFDQYVGRGYSSTKATRETKFVVDVLKFLELGLGWYQILGSGPTSNEAGGNYSTKGFPAEKNAPSPAFKLNMRRCNHHHQPVACIADYYVRSTHTRPKRAQENLNVLERYRQLSQDWVKWFCFLYVAVAWLMKTRSIIFTRISQTYRSVFWQKFARQHLWQKFGRQPAASAEGWGGALSGVSLPWFPATGCLLAQLVMKQMPNHIQFN